MQPYTKLVADIDTESMGVLHVSLTEVGFPVECCFQSEGNQGKNTLMHRPSGNIRGGWPRSNDRKVFRRWRVSARLTKNNKPWNKKITLCFDIWRFEEKKSFCPLVVLIGRLFGPRRRHVGGEGHVVVGAGRGLVREVRREERRPVVLYDHGVVLRHVDGRRELIVSWRRQGLLDLLIFRLIMDIRRCVLELSASTCDAKFS